MSSIRKTSMNRRNNPNNPINNRKGSLYNQYLNKSCYYQSKTGVFINPKSEETFVQETMYYFNLEFFQQTQIGVIILCIVKFIPWFHLNEFNNIQDILLLIGLLFASLSGYFLKKFYGSKAHLQRIVILFVLFSEIMMIQFILLDKDLVDLQLWQMLGQIGIFIQNILCLATPIQSAFFIFVENSLLKFMMLCRGKENNYHNNCNNMKEQMQYSSHCYIRNIYDIQMDDFMGIENNLITVYPLLTLSLSFIINRMMRKYWVFINSFQKSDKSNAHLSQKTMTTFFIIDQHMQFVYYTEKGQQFIQAYQTNNSPPITNFSQLFKQKEQQTLMNKDKLVVDKVALFQEKIQEVLQQNKEIEIEVWLDDQRTIQQNNSNNNSQNHLDSQNNQTNPTEESIYYEPDTVGLEQSENQNKVFYKLKMGPITWGSSKMIQIILEKQSKVSDIIQINEYFYDQLFKNATDNISQLEKDYLKWYNMVSLNVIKNDDLKELSKCINEYHQQYINLSTLRFINNEFHKISTKNINEFNIKTNIIQAVELVLVKKLYLVNQIKVLFERSFPSGEVIADDILFHHMMVSILDLIIQPVEEKQKDKLVDSSSFKNNFQLGNDGIQQPRQNAEPVYKKFDYNIDCKLKTIINSKIFVLQFIFEFNCLPETERLISRVFKKVRNADAKEFVDPKDLLNQGKEFVNLYLIFLQLKRLNGEFEFEKKAYNEVIPNDSHKDSNDENCQNEQGGEGQSNHNNHCQSTNVYILSIHLSVQTVQMQTLTGQNSDSMKRARGNMGITVTQNMNQRNLQKNTLRCPAPLNLSFSRDQKIDMSKFNFIWEYRDEKELKKTFDKIRKKPTMNGKIFSNQPQPSRINKLPTNKDIDPSQQPQQSSSQHNIQGCPSQQNQSQQNSNNHNKQHCASITNASSGSSLCNQQDQNSCQNPIPSNQNQQQSSVGVSSFHRDSIRKQSSIGLDLMNLQKISMGHSSPKIVPSNPSVHCKNRRKTSIIQQPHPVLFKEDTSQQQSSSQSIQKQQSGNKIRSLSRQQSHKIQEELNTSDEEEKKDLFLSDQKQSSSNSQYRFPSSSRKIPENPLHLQAGQKSHSINISCSSNNNNSQSSQSTSQQQDKKTGLNSKQQSGEKLSVCSNNSNSNNNTCTNSNNTNKLYDQPDFIIKSSSQQYKDIQSEKIIRQLDSSTLVSDKKDDDAIELMQKQISDALKLFQHLFIQDTSLVVKQIVTRTNALEGSKINIVQQKERESSQRSSPFLIHTQSVTAGSTSYGGGGEDSDNSQQDGTTNTQLRRKIQRTNSKIKRNTTILDTLSGVSGNSFRRSFKIKPQLMKKQFNDSPQIDSFVNHPTESSGPSRVSREFDTLLGNNGGCSNLTTGTPSQNQMVQSVIREYNRQSNNNQDMMNSTQNGIDFFNNDECIQSADEESRIQYNQYDLIDRKRASTYDIPFSMQQQSYFYYDPINSTLLSEQINHSRNITHKRKWLTDDVWRKQHYSRSQTILVNTNNSSIVSQLKQISKLTRGYTDCKHVRNTFSLIKEYYQIIESCSLFLFVLIDFQETPDKSENILSATAAIIRECEERMGVPKTWLIGIIDFQKQQEFLNKNYDKIDYWINQDLSQDTLMEYVNLIKKKEIM